MRQQRHIIASLLIAVLTYGGLVAPLYHSVYMAMGDFYPSDAMAAHHEKAQACHDTPDHAMMPVQGPTMKAPHEGHPECPFMELFSISLLSYQPGAASFNFEQPDEAEFLATANEYWQADAQIAYFLRGPPTV